MGLVAHGHQSRSQRLTRGLLPPLGTFATNNLILKLDELYATASCLLSVESASAYDQQKIYSQLAPFPTWHGSLGTRHTAAILLIAGTVYHIYGAGRHV